MRCALVQLLPVDHRSIEKRSNKRRDSNERPNYRNVSFSLSSVTSFSDLSQCHWLSLHVLTEVPHNRRVCLLPIPLTSFYGNDEAKFLQYESGQCKRLPKRRV